MEMLRKIFREKKSESEAVICTSGEELLRLKEKRPDVEAVLDIFTLAKNELENGIAIGGGTPEDTRRENQIFENAIRALSEHGVVVERSTLESL
jgi:hypothetical protein